MKNTIETIQQQNFKVIDLKLSHLFFQALLWAVSRGHVRIVQLLLTNGADTSKRTLNGSTASDLAILRGQPEVDNRSLDIKLYIASKNK